MRRAVIRRQTTETSIVLELALEGRGRYEVRTGIRFLDHMLELVARHGAFDLSIVANGDLDVDQHHTV
ncbi:MAG: imidazoleglycerol-phosphate dehydratase, partial [Acidobacteria bacterium]|nr:imidazoleglycerol-phosphate dehydratase [Acidobacteriota bacterium]